MVPELTTLSITCLIGVAMAKIANLVAALCDLLDLLEDLFKCLCADCPPGEPGEVIAESPEVQVTAPSPGLTAGAITIKGNTVGGVPLSPVKPTPVKPTPSPAVRPAEKGGK